MKNQNRDGRFCRSIDYLSKILPLAFSNLYFRKRSVIMIAKLGNGIKDINFLLIHTIP